MLELLGLLGGGVFRLLPAVLSFFKEGRDLKYELLRMDKEAELERLRAANRQAEIAAVAQSQLDATWANGLVEAMRVQTQVTGDKWLDRINISVRPILTYWWCLVIYTAHKVILTYSALDANVPLAQLADVIYTEFDRGVVGSIFGFWFLDRALRKTSL